MGAFIVSVHIILEQGRGAIFSFPYFPYLGDGGRRIITTLIIIITGPRPQNGSGCNFLDHRKKITITFTIQKIRRERQKASCHHFCNDKTSSLGSFYKLATKQGRREASVSSVKMFDRFFRCSAGLNFCVTSVMIFWATVSGVLLGNKIPTLLNFSLFWH